MPLAGKGGHEVGAETGEERIGDCPRTLLGGRSPFGLQLLHER